ncbi:hypothetical protein BV25DRAFT_293257 [Artomyces pyxidatus]|uniref:Uncharacterized protein n=1 Tax=Artomyces pyxidatus TaxID=48021 RepID=A0ACB8T690_9AGAM|nr:hypothetical protein BV25DRAFT_293257 [Artomyces pyxidatus]
MRSAEHGGPACYHCRQGRCSSLDGRAGVLANILIEEAEAFRARRNVYRITQSITSEFCVARVCVGVGGGAPRCKRAHRERTCSLRPARRLHAKTTEVRCIVNVANKILGLLLTAYTEYLIAIAKKLEDNSLTAAVSPSANGLDLTSEQCRKALQFARTCRDQFASDVNAEKATTIGTEAVDMLAKSVSFLFTGQHNANSMPTREPCKLQPGDIRQSATKVPDDVFDLLKADHFRATRSMEISHYEKAGEKSEGFPFLLAHLANMHGITIATLKTRRREVVT